MRLTVIALLAVAAFAQWDGYDPDEKWCGDVNCYELLGVNNTWKRSQIKKQYRKLSKDAHPDRFTDPKEKADAEIRFKAMATANEILTSNSKREQYDKYLRMKKDMDSPKESIIVVALIVALVTFAVVHQYNLQKYEKARQNLASQGHIQKYIREKFPETEDKRSKKEKKAAKRKAKNNDADEPFPYTDAQLNAALEATNTLCPEWSGSPSLVDSAGTTMMLPWYTSQLVFLNLRWLIIYGLLQQDYSQADCEYLCYTENNLGAEGWAALTIEDKIERLNVKDKPYRNFALIESLKQQRDEKKSDAKTKKDD